VIRLKRLLTSRVFYFATMLALFAGKLNWAGMSDGGGWG
jgi:hypothetical protein